MQNHPYFPMTLLAVAIISACSSMPSPSLTQAHARYNNAWADSEVTNQAGPELKQAGDALNKADAASIAGESDETVDHLAYLTIQKVSIAQETAKRKTAESVVNNAGNQRTQVRLEARTAEADAAIQQAAIAEETVDRQAAELGVANAHTQRDQALIVQQEMQLEALYAKKTNSGQVVITLGDSLFGSNQARLSQAGMNYVDKLAEFLTQYPEYQVLIEGYTDSLGGNDLNHELSGQRAYAVRTVLIDRNIDRQRITTKSHGEDFPIADNHVSETLQLNRRVKIILSSDNVKNVKR